MTNEEEIALGTDDNNPNSDSDGIKDNENIHPAGGGENYKFTINWQHNGQAYTTQFGIAEDWYLYYKNYPRTGYYYQDGRFATPNDITIQTIAKDITDVSISTGDTCKHCIAIDFVESMIYQYDIEYIKRADWPKYAIETIVDQRGDCEDTSFLMAAVLKALNIDVILLKFPGHLAVGVYCTNCEGVYIEHNGRKYYYLETTSDPGAWKLGGTSQEYINTLEGIIAIP